MLDPAGKVIDRYDKINLVPFGEFIPPLFGWVNKITKEIGDFVPGDRVVIFPVGEHKLGAFICYESVFPDLVRQFTNSGAEVLVNLSNDGYFGNSAAHAQHLEIARMRAAENRRWILRATNDGISAAIDPRGRIREQMPPFTQTAAMMSFEYETAQTRLHALRRLVRLGMLRMRLPYECRITNTSPSLTMYSFPSSRSSPFSLTPGYPS